MKIFLLFFLLLLVSCNNLDEDLKSEYFSFNNISKEANIDYLFYFDDNKKAYFVKKGFLFYIEHDESKLAEDLYTGLKGILKIQEFKNVFLVLAYPQENKQSSTLSKSLYILERNNNFIKNIDILTRIDKLNYVEDFFVLDNKFYLINRDGINTQLYSFEGSYNQEIKYGNNIFKSENY